MKRSRRGGFTLVEILIVVVIMGILASIVIPQFAQSSDDARYSATIQNLQTLRSQIDLYRNQHENKYPGDTSDDGIFDKQMTLPTNEAGATSTATDQGFGDPKFPYGPYITNRLPANPFNGSRKVHTVDQFGSAPTAPPAADDPGWIYELKSGRIKINKDSQTPDGQDFWAL